MTFNPLRWFLRDEAEEYSIGDDAVLRVFYGAMAALSSSGVKVTQETALRSTCVLACLIVRAETFSTLPSEVVRSVGRYRIPDQTHPVSRLLTIGPNDIQTAPEFWRWKQITEDVTGNAYARIVWRGEKEAVEVWPLTGTPPIVFPRKDKGTFVYQYSGDDFTPANVYLASDILHFKGPVLRSPYEGKSIIDLISETIGVNIGSEQFFARMLGNGSHFPGYLETDKVMSDEDFAAISTQLKGFGGIMRAGEVRIFDRGLKYQQNKMTLKDAELTTQLRWQLQQICSVTRVPMASVQDLTNGTYSNTEQQDLALAKHCITPICVNTEAVVRHRLFAREPEYGYKFKLDGLLRGDYKTRTEGEAALVRAGILARNEARSFENLNPLPGLDIPLAELNLGTVDKDGMIHAPAQAEAAVVSALAPIIAEAAAEIRRRRAADVGKGRSLDDTITFARPKLAALCDAHEAAGLAFDADGFLAECLAVTIPPCCTGEHEPGGTK